MLNNKVYFSKSNSVPKETVDKIRRYILKFDLELKEFSGGTYSNSAMDDCEFLIVLPPPLPKKGSGSSNVANVGRGIFQQTQYFYDKRSKINNILIITSYGLCSDKEVAYVEFSTPDYWRVTNQNDYVNYGDIHLQRFNSHISDYFSLKHFPLEKSIAVLDDVFDISGSVKECDLSDRDKPIIYTEFTAWDEVYEEWFTKPEKKEDKQSTNDLVINPDDPEDYSLLLTL
jgi:hypothetical protein